MTSQIEIHGPDVPATTPNVVDVIDIGVIADAELVEWGKVQVIAGKAAITSIERSVHDALADVRRES